MGRTTKVVGFSLPPEIYQKLEGLIKSKHKTRSEFIREMIDVYFQTSKIESHEEAKDLDLQETDFAKILRSYWLLKSKTPLKIIQIGLAIIVNKKGEVLIGARRDKDPWVENLTWVFPGGNLESLDFEKDLKKEVRQETGLNVNVNSLITARVHPDSGFKNVQIVALYFHCTPVDNKNPKAGGELVKLKWVKPTDVFKYFTTSTSDDVTKFLTSLQKSS